MTLTKYLLMLIPVLAFAENPFCLNGANPEWGSELGIGLYRHHIVWFEAEPSPGIYNFARSDLAADYLRDTGVQPIIVLKCTPQIPDTSIDADTTGWNCCEREFWEKLHDTTTATNELSWFPEDTARWRAFLTAFVERYDGDGINDYENLGEPFRIYQFEVEYPRVWCKCTGDPVQDYIDYINLSYDVIKAEDSSAIVKMAGYAGADLHLFYEGYIPGDSVVVRSDSTGDFYVTREMLGDSPLFLESHNAFMRIFSEAHYDLYDLHCYGNAQWMPYRTLGMRALFGEKDICTGEGGGPFRFRGENFNPENDSGYISPELAEENAAYVVRYFVGGIANGFKWLAWHCPPEYENWGQTFGDLDLMSIDLEKKPSYWTYAGLSRLIGDYDTAFAIDTLLGEQVAYIVETPSEQCAFFWDLSDSGSEITLLINDGTKLLSFPTVMGDSVWDTTCYFADTTITLTLSRVPIISVGGWSFVKIGENISTPPKNFIYVIPNPFNSSCAISAPYNSTIAIYDLLGNVVNEELQPFARNNGRKPAINATIQSSTQRIFVWHPDKTISSGIYLVKVRLNEEIMITNRIVYLK